MTAVTQTPASEVSEAVALYFQGDIEQSLLIGEEVEIREDSEGSDINTESSSESESDETDDHFLISDFHHAEYNI